MHVVKCNKKKNTFYKTFAKLSRYALGLYIKLVHRNIHKSAENIIENWFDISYTSVRWGRHSSNFLKLSAQCASVRQGGVLSPRQFTVFGQNLSEKR